MSGAETRLNEAFRARDAAHENFSERLAQIQNDVEERGVGLRIADRLGANVKDAVDDTLDIAAESKTAIAGTVAALAVWLFRKPLINWVYSLFDAERDDDKKD